MGYKVEMIKVSSGVRRSQVVTFVAIRLRGLRFKPQPGQKFETRFLLHSHPSGGEGVSPVQGEAIRRRCIKPEYLSYPIQSKCSRRFLSKLLKLLSKHFKRQKGI